MKQVDAPDIAVVKMTIRFYATSGQIPRVS